MKTPTTTGIVAGDTYQRRGACWNFYTAVGFCATIRRYTVSRDLLVEVQG